MKVSYFLYSLLVSVWIFTDAPLYNRSRWWALFTFILPFLTPYYFIKTRPANKYWKYIGLWLLGFLIFHAVEVAFFPKKYQLKSNSKVSPISSSLKDQIIDLSNKSGLSAETLQKVLISLDKIKNLDTLSDINDAISSVEQAQLLFFQANEDSDRLSDFINKNKMQLLKEGLGVFIEMEGLIDEAHFSYRKALREYLNSHKDILEYLRDNFEPIKRGQQPQSNTFKQLYIKLGTAQDICNEAYLRKEKSVDQYLKEHPDLVEFINKARQKLKEK
jgi:hypothetical protein